MFPHGMVKTAKRKFYLSCAQLTLNIVITAIVAFFLVVYGPTLMEMLNNAYC